MQTLSSDLVEGVPYLANLSNYKGYVFGAPEYKVANGFLELVKWLYEYDRPTSTLKIWREDDPDNSVITIFDNIPEILEISMCFNRSMDAVVAYVDKRGSFVYSYDPTVSEYRSVRYEGFMTPRVALTSVHPWHEPYAQVVLGYMTANNELFIRFENERYATPHLVKKFPTSTKLQSISFSDVHRFQYEVLEAQ